jgi:hypothetical protein
VQEFYKYSEDQISLEISSVLEDVLCGALLTVISFEVGLRGRVSVPNPKSLH